MTEADRRACLRCKVVCLRLVRGVCWPCYQRCRRQVAAGEATWEGLEAEGRILRANLDTRKRRAWMDGFYKSKFADGSPPEESL
jgi:hypothetical protein